LPVGDWTPPATPPPGEGFVLIGTRAIRWRDLWADLPPDAQVHRIDLGRAWTEWTGLPFVFAVWALRGGTDLPPAQLDALVRGLEDLKQANRARLRELVAAWGGLAEERQTPAEALRYLTENIDFTLDEPALRGLERFHAEGARLGLFPAGWRPRVHTLLTSR
jgi:chorismate dehydratase